MLSSFFFHFLFFFGIGVSSISIDNKRGLVIVAGNIDPSKLVEAVKKIGRKAEILAYEKDPSLVQEKLNHLFNKIHNSHNADSDSSFDDDDDNEDDDSDVFHDENCEFANHHNNPRTKPRHDHPHRHPYPQHHNVHGKGEFGGNIPRGGTTQGYGYGYGPSRPPPARPPYGYQGYHHQPGMYGRPRPPPPPPYPYYDHYQQGMYHRPRPPPPPPPPAAYYDHYRPMMPQPGVPPMPPYGSCFKSRDPPVGNSVFHYFSDDNSKACTIM